MQGNVSPDEGSDSGDDCLGRCGAVSGRDRWIGQETDCLAVESAAIGGPPDSGSHGCQGAPRNGDVESLAETSECPPDSAREPDPVLGNGVSGRSCGCPGCESDSDCEEVSWYLPSGERTCSDHLACIGCPWGL